MKIKEKLKSKVNIFGKQVSVFMIMLVLMASVGTAAHMHSYGTITGTAQLQQAIELTGEGCWSGDNECTYQIANSPMYDGDTQTSGQFSITNHAQNGIEVLLSVIVAGESNGDGLGCEQGNSIDSEDVIVRYLVNGEYLSINRLVIPPETQVPLHIQTTFAVGVCPGLYTVTTFVQPGNINE